MLFGVLGFRVSLALADSLQISRSLVAMRIYHAVLND